MPVSRQPLSKDTPASSHGPVTQAVHFPGHWGQWTPQIAGLSAAAAPHVSPATVYYPGAPPSAAAAAVTSPSAAKTSKTGSLPLTSNTGVL